MVVANLGVSIPVFVLGLMLAYLFALVLKDTPFALPAIGPPELRASTSCRWSTVVGPRRTCQGPPRAILDFLSGIYTLQRADHRASGRAWADALRHLILPAVALGTIPLAIIARITRSSLLEVLGLDYVRTARAKGLGSGRWSCGTRRATPCCRSSRSSGSSSARCCPARS